ncbi:hypothetical protein SBA4_100038 [Candidatus Sulfopaludibacter sp. SbA4]|nr:hypothetical protein SBA4_100038 [Candidatus Sulfopaludibacter sp. SbA4]
MDSAWTELADSLIICVTGVYPAARPATIESSITGILAVGEVPFAVAPEKQGAHVLAVAAEDLDNVDDPRTGRAEGFERHLLARVLSSHREQACPEERRAQGLPSHVKPLRVPLYRGSPRGGN